jgi:hypothetical protein
MSISCITKKEIKKGEEINSQYLREGIFNLVKKDYPEFSKNCSITMKEIKKK